MGRSWQWSRPRQRIGLRQRAGLHQRACPRERAGPREWEEGSILLEFLLVLLILILLTFGAFEFGRALSIKQALDVGTYNAARCLSLDPDDWATAEGLIHAELQTSVLGRDYADRFTWTPHVGDRSFGTLLTVEAYVDFTFDVPLMNLGGVRLYAAHRQPIERYP